VNCGAGGRTSLRQLISLAERVTGRSITVAENPPRGGDVRDSLASLERAREILGYTPHVALDEGLRLTWEWMSETESTSVSPAARVSA
jgi:nucleoside-diphosphate-sugar epimerase